MKQLYVLLLCPILLWSQVQMGSDIDGPEPDDHFGQEIQLSRTGQIVAVLGFETPAKAKFQVFQYNGDDWELYGTEEGGSHFESFNPIGMALSDDGSVLALAENGEVTVFSNISGTWTPRGSVIPYPYTSSTTYNFGDIMSLSADGNTIAIVKATFCGSRSNMGPPPPIGCPGSSIFIYKFNGDDWEPHGDALQYGNLGTNDRGSIELTPDGETLAVSVKDSVGIFQNTADSWLPKGASILAEEGDLTRVSISSKGDMIAVANSNYSGGMDQMGKVTMYVYENDSWVQRGDPILGAASNEFLGVGLSMADNGNTVAIGKQNTGATTLGSVQVYNFQNETWTPQGTAISSSESGDLFGTVVSLSGNGNTLAIGAPNHGASAGQVKVYDLSGLLSNESFSINDVKFYPNPANTEVIIELPVTAYNGQLQITNMLGQEVLSTTVQAQQVHLDVSNWRTGLYVLRVSGDFGEVTKKFVVE